SFILIEEDISDRKGHAELAARVQRELLPHMVPEVEGYEVAGACLSAMEVAGDFYDWVLDDQGRLQFTVADVMGKGMGAALVTATDCPEGTTRLEPGDALLVYSDGLVETEERTIQPPELTAGIDESMHAAEVVRRLIARMPSNLSDDVTAVALHRLSESPRMA